MYALHVHTRASMCVHVNTRRYPTTPFPNNQCLKHAPFGEGLLPESGDLRMCIFVAAAWGVRVAGFDWSNYGVLHMNYEETSGGPGASNRTRHRQLDICTRSVLGSRLFFDFGPQISRAPPQAIRGAAMFGRVMRETPGAFRTVMEQKNFDCVVTLAERQTSCSGSSAVRLSLGACIWPSRERARAESRAVE